MRCNSNLNSTTKGQLPNGVPRSAQLEAKFDYLKPGSERRFEEREALKRLTKANP